jgi:hypothetical protein
MGAGLSVEGMSSHGVVKKVTFTAGTIRDSPSGCVHGWGRWQQRFAVLADKFQVGYAS